MFDKRKESSEPEEQQGTASKSSTRETSNLNSRSTAMIGKTIQVKGDITGSENLTIEGTVNGSVDLPQNDLTVGESGNVTADLKAKTVRVDGQVTGDISGAEKIVVSATGRVKGNMTAPRVTLEDGAKFKGSIDMDPGEGKAAAAPGKAAPAAPKEIRQEAG
jgi:cytoskeletal protein CcmA (bactofilin family)